MNNTSRASKTCANSINLSVLKKDEEGYFSTCAIYEELKKVVVLEKKNASLSNYIKELETVVENKEKEIITQKNKIKELEDKNEKLSDNVDERKKLRDTKADKESKTERTKCEIKELETVVQDKEKEIISQKNRIEELEDKNKKLLDIVDERNKLPDPKADKESKTEGAKYELSPVFKNTSCFIKQENPSLAFVTQSVQVVIQKREAGAIIGPCGSRIQAIRSESKASIVIEDEVIGSDTRIVTIVGTIQQIESAKFLLQKVIRLPYYVL